MGLCGLACGLTTQFVQAQQADGGPVNGSVIVQPGAPGMPTKRLPAATTGQATPTSKADVAFMQGMVMHHGQAVAMTDMIPSRTENKEIRALGAKIGLSQTDEMKFMQRWLKTHGEATSMKMPMAMPGMEDMDINGNPMPSMPGMLSPEQIKALSEAKGAAFDRLFLTGMIQHHKGALVMVKELFDAPGAGQDADLFDFATDADNTQRAEIVIMQAMLKKM